MRDRGVDGSPRACRGGGGGGGGAASIAPATAASVPRSACAVLDRFCRLRRFEDEAPELFAGRCFSLAGRIESASCACVR